MTIDQLPTTTTDNVTDEVPVCQGTSTMKTTWNKIIQLIRSGFNGTATPLPPAETAAVGTSIRFSHEDHVHPLPSSIDAGDVVSFKTASITNNSSRTLDFGTGGTSTAVFVTGTAASRMASILMLCTAAGVVHASVTGSSGITVTQAQSGDFKGIISNATGGSVYLLVVNYRGNAPTIS